MSFELEQAAQDVETFWRRYRDVGQWFLSSGRPIRFPTISTRIAPRADSTAGVRRSRSSSAADGPARRCCERCRRPPGARRTPRVALRRRLRPGFGRWRRRRRADSTAGGERTLRPVGTRRSHGPGRPRRGRPADVRGRRPSAAVFACDADRRGQPCTPTRRRSTSCTSAVSPPCSRNPCSSTSSAVPAATPACSSSRLGRLDRGGRSPLAAARHGRPASRPQLPARTVRRDARRGPRHSPRTGAAAAARRRRAAVRRGDGRPGRRVPPT